VAGGSIVGPELAALLAGLVVYTTSHIAEVVRGSIQAVSKGQSEAALALGLGASQRLRFVILPQAFRIAIPPMSNQYLNLTKNSSLGVLIGYPELMRVTRIAIGSGAPAPQTIVVLMLIYLLFSIVIAGGANLANRRLQLRGAR
jgi:general L-amino acid transport system permease protein